MQEDLKWNYLKKLKNQNVTLRKFHATLIGKRIGIAMNFN
jgi:hypothetical protein